MFIISSLATAYLVAKIAEMITLYIQYNKNIDCADRAWLAAAAEVFSLEVESHVDQADEYRHLDQRADNSGKRLP